MDLVNSQMKLEARQAMKDIFDTFKRTKPVVFYKTAKEEVTFFDPNYNADFMEMNQAPSIQSTSVSKAFYVRIWYMDRQEYNSYLKDSSDLNVKVSQFYNRIKIQMELDAFEFLKDTERFTFEGEKYTISESWKRVGILGEFQFYEIILMRVP